MLLRKKKAVDDFFFACLLLQIQYLILRKQVNQGISWDFIKNCSSRGIGRQGTQREYSSKPLKH